MGKRSKRSGIQLGPLEVGYEHTTLHPTRFYFSVFTVPNICLCFNFLHFLVYFCASSNENLEENCEHV